MSDIYKVQTSVITLFCFVDILLNEKHFWLYLESVVACGVVILEGKITSLHARFFINIVTKYYLKQFIAISCSFECVYNAFLGIR